MKKFLVIGPTFFDVNLEFKDILNFQRPNTHISIGGKGYNIAHTLRLFNFPVLLATMYGHDCIGQYFHRCISEQDVEEPETNLIDHESSIFLCVNDHSGKTILDRSDTSIFSYQKRPDIDWNQIDFAIVLSSTNQKILDYLRTVKREYPNIIFCLEIAGRKSVRYVEPFLDIFDFFISNYREALQFGSRAEEQLDVADIIKILLSQGPQLVLITCAEDGIICGQANADSNYSISRFPIHGGRGRIVSTVGAGDAVTASFCASYYGYGFPLSDSIEIAMDLAAHTIRQRSPFINRLPRSMAHILSAKRAM